MVECGSAFIGEGVWRRRRLESIIVAAGMEARKASWVMVPREGAWLLLRLFLFIVIVKYDSSRRDVDAGAGTSAANKRSVFDGDGWQTEWK